MAHKSTEYSLTLLEGISLKVVSRAVIFLEASRETLFLVLLLVRGYLSLTPKTCPTYLQLVSDIMFPTADFDVFIRDLVIGSIYLPRTLLPS